MRRRRRRRRRMRRRRGGRTRGNEKHLLPSMSFEMHTS